MNDVILCGFIIGVAIGLIVTGFIWYLEIRNDRLSKEIREQHHD
jgi:hypothetical protein